MRRSAILSHHAHVGASGRTKSQQLEELHRNLEAALDASTHSSQLEQDLHGRALPEDLEQIAMNIEDIGATRDALHEKIDNL